MQTRIVRVLLAIVAAVALTAAGLAVNFILLGYADSRHDPVGKLTPRATITQQTAPASTQTAKGGGSEADSEEADD
jgi:hypothetical protein